MSHPEGTTIPCPQSKRSFLLCAHASCASKKTAGLNDAQPGREKAELVDQSFEATAWAKRNASFFRLAFPGVKSGDGPFEGVKKTST